MLRSAYPCVFTGSADEVRCVKFRPASTDAVAAAVKVIIAGPWNGSKAGTHRARCRPRSTVTLHQGHLPFDPVMSHKSAPRAKPAV